MELSAPPLSLPPVLILINLSPYRSVAITPSLYPRQDLIHAAGSWPFNLCPSWSRESPHPTHTPWRRQDICYSNIRQGKSTFHNLTISITQWATLSASSCRSRITGIQSIRRPINPSKLTCMPPHLFHSSFYQTPGNTSLFGPFFLLHFSLSLLASIVLVSVLSSFTVPLVLLYQFCCVSLNLLLFSPLSYV